MTKASNNLAVSFTSTQCGGALIPRVFLIDYQTVNAFDRLNSPQCDTQQTENTRETSLLINDKSTYYCNKLLLHSLHIVDCLRDVCVVSEII